MADPNELIMHESMNSLLADVRELRDRFEAIQSATQKLAFQLEGMKSLQPLALAPTEDVCNGHHSVEAAQYTQDVADALAAKVISTRTQLSALHAGLRHNQEIAESIAVDAIKQHSINAAQSETLREEVQEIKKSVAELANGLAADQRRPTYNITEQFKESKPIPTSTSRVALREELKSELQQEHMIDECYNWEALASYYHGIGSIFVPGIDRCQTKNGMFGG